MLRVHVLGPLRVEADGSAIDTPGGRRAAALLAWLALHPGRARPRGRSRRASGPTSWTRAPARACAARLWSLRRALGPAGAVVAADGDRVGLEDDGALWVDARAFEELVAAGRGRGGRRAVRRRRCSRASTRTGPLEARDAHRERLGAVLERLARDARRPATARRRSGGRAARPSSTRSTRRRTGGSCAGSPPPASAPPRVAVYERLAERLRRELRLAPSAAARRAAAVRRRCAPEAPGRRRAGPARPARAAARRPRAGARRAARGVGRRRARAGGAVVLIAATPGIGKTRLVARAARARPRRRRRAPRRARRSTSAADGERGGAALGLWAELLARARARGAHAPPPGAAWPAELAALVPDAAAAARAPRRRPARGVARPRARAAVRGGGRAARVGGADTRPLALALEDVHLADAPSLELLAYAGRRAARLPVLLVLTRRPLPPRAEVDALEQALRARGVAAPDDRARRRCGRRDVARLARRRSRRSAARDVAQVVAAAEGNPLLAVERARAARARRARAAGRACAAPCAPRSPPLTPGARRLLAELRRRRPGAASTAPSSTGCRSPTRRAPRPPPSRRGLLVAAGGRVGYRHALLREAAYADLPEPRRAWLHEALAAAVAPTTTRAARPRSRATCGSPGATTRRRRRAARAARHALRRRRARRGGRASSARRSRCGRTTRALLADARRGRGVARTRGGGRGRVRDRGRPPRAGGRPASRSRARVAAPGRRRARAGVRAAHRAHGGPPRARRSSTPRRTRPPRCAAEALAACAWARGRGRRRGRRGGAARRRRAPRHRRRRPPRARDRPRPRARAHPAGAVRREPRAVDRRRARLAERAGRPDLAYGAWSNAACAAACDGDFERALGFVDRGARRHRAAGGCRSSTSSTSRPRAYVLARLGRLDEAAAAADEEAALAERLAEPGARARPPSTTAGWSRSPAATTSAPPSSSARALERDRAR